MVFQDHTHFCAQHACSKKFLLFILLDIWPLFQVIPLLASASSSSYGVGHLVLVLEPGNIVAVLDSVPVSDILLETEVSSVAL